MALKGIAWGIVFFCTAIFYFLIPSYLIVKYWVWLNSFPIYTLALFMLFLWIVAIILGLIYIVAMVRAFIQRNNLEGLGIPKGVKLFGLISTIIVFSFMLIWYLIFDQIAFFSWVPPS